MQNVRIIAILSKVFVLLSIGTAGQIVVSAATPNTPLIYSTAADLSSNPKTLTITGLNFGRATHVVGLNGLTLSLASFTDSVVVAFLPDNIAPGSYDLVVGDKGDGNNVAEFDATIGATGPQGAAGPAGPAGPQGLTG